MDVSVARNGSMVIASVEGRLEGPGMADTLLHSLDDAFAPEDSSLIVDLEAVTYISSAGLRIIAIMLNRTRRAGAQLLVCGCSASVREVFSTSGFDQLVRVMGTLDDAKALAAG